MKSLSSVGHSALKNMCLIPFEILSFSNYRTFILSPSHCVLLAKMSGAKRTKHCIAPEESLGRKRYNAQHVMFYE